MLSYLLIVCVHGEACYFGPVKMEGHDVFGRETANRTQTIAVAENFDKAKFYMEALDEAGRLTLNKSDALTKLGIIGAVAVTGKGWVFHKQSLLLFVPTLLQTWQEIKDLDKILKSLMDRYSKKDQVFKPAHRCVDPLKHDVHLKELQDKLARLEKEKKNLEDQCTKQHKEINTLMDEKDKLKYQQEKFKENQIKIDEVHTELNRLKEEKLAQEETLRNLQQTSGHIQKEKDNIETEKQRLQTELDGLKTQSAEQENRLRNQIDQLTQEHRALEESYRNAQQTTANGQREEDIDGEKQRLTEDIEQKKREIDRLTQDLTRLQMKSAEQEAEFTKLCSTSTRIINEKQDLTNQLEEKLRKIENLYAKLKELRRDSMANEEKIMTLTLQQQDILLTCHRLYQNIANLEIEKARVEEEKNILIIENIRTKEEMLRTQENCIQRCHFFEDIITASVTSLTAQRSVVQLEMMSQAFCNDAITLKREMEKDAHDLLANLRQTALLIHKREQEKRLRNLQRTSAKIILEKGDLTNQLKEKLRKIENLDAELKELRRDSMANEEQIMVLTLQRQEIQLTCDRLNQNIANLEIEKARAEEEKARAEEEKNRLIREKIRTKEEMLRNKNEFDQTIKFYDNFVQEIHRLEWQQKALIQFFVQIIDKTTHDNILEPRHVNSYEDFYQKLNRWVDFSATYEIQSHDLAQIYMNHVEHIANMEERTAQIQAKDYAVPNQSLDMTLYEKNKQNYCSFIAFVAQTVTQTTQKIVDCWPENNFAQLKIMLERWSQYPSASVLESRTISQCFAWSQSVKYYPYPKPIADVGHGGDGRQGSQHGTEAAAADHLDPAPQDNGHGVRALEPDNGNDGVRAYVADYV